MVGLSFAFAMRQEWLGLCIFYAMIAGFHVSCPSLTLWHG